MAILKTQTLPVQAESDIVRVRRAVGGWSGERRGSRVDRTEIVTAASELARNVLVHGGGGEARLSVLQEGIRRGLRVVFEDHGPGIPDVALAMQDGYTTGGTLGLGLGGAKRLVNDFDIVSVPGEGTRVTITRWR